MTETTSGLPAPTDVVTCFLRNRGDVLLVRRSTKVGTYRGRWGGVAGHVETDDALEDARREIQEETGLQDHVALVKRGEPFTFTDQSAGRSWRVHPFLFDSSSRNVHLDWEAAEGVWVAPTAILARQCVPRLWTSYARVAPTLEDVRADRKHGSTYLSLRALEVLRDRAAALAARVEAPGATARGAPAPRGGWVRGFGADGAPGLGVAVGGPEPTRVSMPAAGEADDLGSLARALRQAQPAMTALHNRIDNAMDLAETMQADAAESVPDHVDYGAPPCPAVASTQSSDAVVSGRVDSDEANSEAPGSAALSSSAVSWGWAPAVAAAAQVTLAQSLAAEDALVSAAARLLAGRRVLTLSLSATVSRALLVAAPAPELVVVMESRPGAEGRTLAGRLAARDIDATLVPDAAVAWALAEFNLDLVVVGADTVLSSGDIVNKVGTHVAALAARAAGVPVLAVATRDKIAAEDWHLDATSEGEASDSALEAAAGPGPESGPAREPGSESELGSESEPGSGSGHGSESGSGPEPERTSETRMRWRSPLFERTPAALIAGVVTEIGVLDAAGVWREKPPHRQRHLRSR